MAEVINLGRLGLTGEMFTDGFVGTGGNGSRIFALNLESATQFFREITVLKENVLMNSLGVYSIANIGRDLKIKTQSLTTPRHLLQGRTNCQTWRPKGKAALIPKEVETYPYEYNGEQCADSFFDNCMERLLAQGVKVWDMMATEEGRRLLNELVNSIFDGLRNSLYDLVNFSQDNFAEQSNAAGWWQTTGVETAATWADFYDQQFAKALIGLIPQIEIYKTQAGYTNFQVDIPLADVSGATYNGDVAVLLRACMDAAKPRFRQVLSGRNGRNISSVFLVSPSIFSAYRQYLIDTYVTISESYYLLVDGVMIPGVLMFDGIPIYSMDEWAMYDGQIGVNTHRVVLTALGNMVVATNIETQDYMDGFGFIMEQRPEISAKGKQEMFTTFRLGADIAEPDFMVNASIVTDPSGNELTYTP